MREHIREFAEDVAEVMPIADPVVEIGARAAEGQDEVANLRNIFPSTRYIGCDVQPGPGVDQIEDVHALTFADDSIGTVVSFDTLEHIADPLRALQEIHRVLAPGGVVAISSVMLFPIHAHPWDYWRFTPEGFDQLLRPFRTRLVMSLGIPELPETVLGIGVKGAFPDLVPERFPRTMANHTTMRRSMSDITREPPPSTRELWVRTLEATARAVRRRVRVRPPGS